jgi:hypothetical protein
MVRRCEKGEGFVPNGTDLSHAAHRIVMYVMHVMHVMHVQPAPMFFGQGSEPDGDESCPEECAICFESGNFVDLPCACDLACEHSKVLSTSFNTLPSNPESWM